jgi:CheY-like chemotaxis protein
MSEDISIFAVGKSAPVWKAAESVLRRKDPAVVFFRSGAQALEQARKTLPRLMMFEYDLDGLTGPDLCRQVRGSDETRHVSLLFVSDRDDDGQVDLCMAAGCNDIVFLPLDSEDLHEKIERLTEVPVRKELRTLIRVEVSVEHHSFFMLGHSRNISVNGMLVELAQVLPPDATLQLHFYLRGEAEPLHVPARVVRAEFTGGLPKYGMRFTTLSPRDRQRINTYVGRMRSREWL